MPCARGRRLCRRTAERPHHNSWWSRWCLLHNNDGVAPPCCPLCGDDCAANFRSTAAGQQRSGGAWLRRRAGMGTSCWCRCRDSDGRPDPSAAQAWRRRGQGHARAGRGSVGAKQKIVNEAKRARLDARC